MEQYGTIDSDEIEEMEFIDEESKDEIVPFSGFAEHWIRNYAMPNNKPSEIKNKRYVIRVHLHPYFQDQDIRTISPEQIERFIGIKISAGLSKKSVNVFLAVLRKMLTKAVDWEYLEKSPMDRIKALKVDPKDPAFYSPKETMKFLQECQKEYSDYYSFFLTAFLTGMRHGELRALQWRDLDFENSNIRVCRSLWRKEMGTPKGRKARTIPMHSHLKEILQAISQKKPKSSFVFSQSDGSAIGINAGSKVMNSICKKAQIRRLRFHDIRHSFASQLAMNGQPLIVVQELLGHADIQTTMVYAHLTPSFSANAVETLIPEIGPKSGTHLVPIKITNPHSESAMRKKASNFN